MRKLAFLAATALSATNITSAYAQTSGAPPQAAQDDEGIADIVVTAQRQSETAQTVPIAITAFSAETLKAQQINTTSDLQLTLPNITYSKGNFTSSSSFNIRGIGDLCVGIACDSATAIHVNDVPILGSPIFQNEYFDLERLEVLRGPQGTLYGRNATAGVINFITAKPNLAKFEAAGEFEYGNFNSIRVKGMVNVPISETLGVRLAGYYLKRDGFTNNLFDNTKIDGRDQFDIRGSIRWQPSADTKLDIVAHYFREKDNRSRIQKQLCHRDPTGVLGCLPDRLENQQLNGNATLASILTSREFLTAAVGASFTNFGLGSIYGTDVYANFTNPAGVRNVSIDSPPTFFTDEKQILAHFEQDFGKAKLTVSGGYTEGTTDSSVDYNLGVERSFANNPGLLTLLGTAAAPGALFPGGVNPYTQLAALLLPNGPAGNVCQSLAEPSGTGVFGGHTICAPTSLDFDRSTATTNQWTAEGILESKIDGPVNFLVGGIYLNTKTTDNDYYVNSFALDYTAGILGAANALGARVAGATIPNVYAASPFFRSNSARFELQSYGLFGEAYWNVSDRVKLTLGGRYNHDQKSLTARTTLFNDANTNAVLVPYGATDLTQAINYGTRDFDANKSGIQPFAINSISFNRFTGRAVLDFQITPRNLVYASYSRGYKSGGINPPLSPIFEVPIGYGPESVNAFELGTKNTLLGGSLRLNLTAFYYQYKQLQLSRIVARTSVNDNVDANIYGLEAEAVIKPSRSLLMNLNFSYLHTQISSDKFLANTQDPSGGRSDAVIIKDLTNASNCAVGSNTGSAAQVNAFVGATNAILGLRAPTAVPGTTTTGAYSICGILQAAAAGNIAAANPALAAAQAALGGLTPQQFINFSATGNPGTAASIGYFPGGVETNIRGNQLPQSPSYKFSAGIQYTKEFGDGMSIVPRFDFSYTGEYFGSIFNRNINKIQGYAIMNAQVQLNGPDGKWYVRGFVQNLQDNSAITGLYVTDQSSGLFTNAFTLEPRRYGISAGFKF